jgi:hypothetical protein
MRKSLLRIVTVACTLMGSALTVAAVSSAQKTLLQSPDKNLTPEEAQKERRQFLERLAKADPEKRRILIKKRLERIAASRSKD